MRASRATFTTLAREFIEQLEFEHSELDEILTRAHELRTALLGRDVVRLQDAAMAMDQQRNRYTQIGSRRHLLCDQLAQLLAVPKEHATLSRLQPLLDEPLRARLDHLRRSLRRITAHIERINRANLMVIRQLEQLLQDACDLITGQHTANRYTSNGQMTTPESVSLFQTDC